MRLTLVLDDAGPVAITRIKEIDPEECDYESIVETVEDMIDTLKKANQEL